MTFTRYEEAERWITGLVPFGIRPGLRRVEHMMEKLGHPERRLKFIHIAGTNGKGSTSACIASVLQACGYDVGTFNSPYITRYTDRIRLNGQDIPDEAVVDIANRLHAIAKEMAESELGPPTMFEVTTALAIEYFARWAYPDFVVWETGLGGRLDSTNVVTPIVSVITNVGHDHTEILGDTLEQVAGEKAGIIKPGVPVVCTADHPDAIRVLEQAAASRRSPFYLHGREFRAETEELQAGRTSFNFAGPFREMHSLAVSLSGAHQAMNAAAALMTLEVLRQYYAVIVDDEPLRQGLLDVRWPGRLELVSEQPRILIDGAHNPEGAESLADAIVRLYPHEKLHLMIGMLSTKNHSAYLWHILPIVDTLIVSEPDFRKKLDAAALAQVAETLRSERAKPHLRVIVEPDWQAALDRLRQVTEPRDLAVVSGTLYLISDVRSFLFDHKTSDKGW